MVPLISISDFQNIDQQSCAKSVFVSEIHFDQEPPNKLNILPKKSISKYFFFLRLGTVHKLRIYTYSAAWANVIPAKLWDNVSVYISHPVPCR